MSDGPASATEFDDGDGSTTTIDVPATAAGQRLDVFLASVLPLSRSRLKKLVDDGGVRIDEEPVRASATLRGGERVVVIEPAAVATTLIAEDLPLVVLFEDDDMLVIDKAAGMAVHPGAGIPRGTVANAVLFRCRRALSIGGEVRPGIVHRLDKDTSGVLVVAKHDDAHRALAAAFAARATRKEYAAWSLGTPAFARAVDDDRRPTQWLRDSVFARVDRAGIRVGGDDGVRLVTGHRRADGDRRRFTTRVPPPQDDAERDGAVRRAVASYRVDAERGGVAAVRVVLVTGRTHQIRAQLADVGHPLVQDELYGGARAQTRLPASPVRDAVVALARQALHARRLTLAHPRTGATLTFEAPLPPDVARLDDAVRH